MIGLINDFSKYTGSGNYAFSLFEELKKIELIEMHYINYEEKKIVGEKIIEEKPVNIPILKRTLNSFYFLPKKMSKYSLIHVSNQFLSNYAKFNKNTVITCLDLIPLETPKEYPFTTSFFLKKAIKSMNKAKKIITISDYSKQKLIELAKINEEKIKTVYLGVDKKKFYPKNKITCRTKLNLPLDKKIILNVGSEEKRKNIKTLVNAFELILKENKNTILIRVGEKNKRIQKIIKEKKLEKNIIYFNNIDSETLLNIYNSADLLIFPSILEGFGFGPLEAMSCKTPVLSSLKTSLKEIVPKKLGLENPFNEKEISEKAIELLTNVNKSKINAKIGFEWSEKFNWKNTAKKTKQVYGEILKR